MDRGQMHTLEAFLAALLLVGALLFASQATAVTPLSASTSNQHIENQQQTMAEDVLAHAARDGTLQEALLYWNTSEGEEYGPHFAGTDPNRSTYSTVVGTGHPLNASLEDAFGDGIYAYNVELRYVDESGELATVDMIDMGSPSDNAVTATRTVVLFEDDELGPGGERLANLAAEEFWASPHPEGEGAVYNVVEVRMTIWRM